MAGRAVAWDLLLLRHAELLVLAVREHLIELIEEHGVRLDALVVVHCLSLDVGSGWGVGAVAASKLKMLVTNRLLVGTWL
mgnify:CR=1 FL=1